MTKRTRWIDGPEDFSLVRRDFDFNADDRGSFTASCVLGDYRYVISFSGKLEPGKWLLRIPAYSKGSRQKYRITNKSKSLIVSCLLVFAKAPGMTQCANRAKRVEGDIIRAYRKARQSGSSLE